MLRTTWTSLVAKSLVCHLIVLVVVRVLLLAGSVIVNAYTVHYRYIDIDGLDFGTSI